MVTIGISKLKVIHARREGGKSYRLIAKASLIVRFLLRPFSRCTFSGI